MISSKKWLTIFFSIIIICALLVAIVVFVVDPYFHYHAPVSFLSYNFNGRSYERYVNNGIVKNFDYDAMIVGTSHTENFKTSEFNELWGCNSIKVPLSGAEFKELAEQTEVAIRHNNNLKYILTFLTYQDILNDKDAVRYEDYPTYLYDENIFNDYKYLFSGQALKKSIKNILYTLQNKETTSFDEYANWNDKYTYSKKKVLRKYERVADKVPATSLTNEEKDRVIGNINQNLVELAKANPDIEFYFCLAPNNIAWWDSVSQSGEILKYLEAEEILINSLLELDNVKLYSFFNNYSLTCNLNYYRDFYHFSEDVNSQILKWVKNDEYLITKENATEYLEQEKEFYLNYNYDAIFAK